MGELQRQAGLQLNATREMELGATAIDQPALASAEPCKNIAINVLNSLYLIKVYFIIRTYNLKLYLETT